MSFKEKKSTKLSYLIRIPDNIDDQKNVNIIFFMHGYGDSMKGISQIGNLLKPENIHVFFNAPFKMDVGFGAEGFRWFEFPSNEDEFKFSQQAISQTISEILNDIKFNIKGIFIGGFSQGGMMTLHNNYNEKVDGLIILGSQLFYENKEFNLKKKTKIFMSHGTYDQVIPIMGSTQTLNFLRKKGFSVDYKEYPIGHEISLDQINELNNWIDKI